MAATIKAYVREAMAAEKAGMKVETKPRRFQCPSEELKEKFRSDPRFKRAFEALTPLGGTMVSTVTRANSSVFDAPAACATRGLSANCGVELLAETLMSPALMD